MTAGAKNIKSTQPADSDDQPKPASGAKASKGAATPTQVEIISGKQKKTSTSKAKRSPKGAKPAKQKMVRDSFSLPENDYSKLSLLKAKCLENGIEVKKSEIVRAGLIALTRMSMANLIKALGEVERLKTGRPKSD